MYISDPMCKEPSTRYDEIKRKKLIKEVKSYKKECATFAKLKAKRKSKKRK